MSSEQQTPATVVVNCKLTRPDTMGEIERDRAEFPLAPGTYTLKQYLFWIKFDYPDGKSLTPSVVEVVDERTLRYMGETIALKDGHAAFAFSFGTWDYFFEFDVKRD